MIIVAMLYAPSLAGVFMVDDHRQMRHLREYHDGVRGRPELYEFLPGGGENAAQRRDGWMPWWISDDLRFRYWRPITEQALCLQYRAFGDHPFGYRLVSLMLYAAVVRICLSVFRRFAAVASSAGEPAGGERIACWAALVFAVAGGHVMPVIFVSAQCDLWAAFFASAAVLLFLWYIATGTSARSDAVSPALAASVILYVLALASKEAALPVCVLPLAAAVLHRGDTRAVRRAWIAAGVLLAVAAAYLVWYAAGGFGSNNTPVLDPVGRPLDYLRLLPLRALLLVCAAVFPGSPFFFELTTHPQFYISIYAAVAGGILAVLVVLYLRRWRHRPDVRAAALWVLLFLPLLACTLPDDRLMMLPSIGVAWLAAVWLVEGRGPEDAGRGGRVGLGAPGAPRLGRIPALLFILAPMFYCCMSMFLAQFMEREAQRHLRIALDGFDRPPRGGDCVFLINSARQVEGLFAQDRMRSVASERTESTGGDAAPPIRTVLLCDTPDPALERIDDRTLRLTAGETPFFSSFIGRMGRVGGRNPLAGEQYDAGELTATILRVDEAGVQAVELRFRRPLTDQGYQFLWSSPDRPPARWNAADSPRP